MWVEAKLPMSSSLGETVKMVHTLREKLSGFPEVRGVLSQTGRSNDGTDPSGFLLRTDAGEPETQEGVDP